MKQRIETVFPFQMLVEKLKNFKIGIKLILIHIEYVTWNNLAYFNYTALKMPFRKIFLLEEVWVFSEVCGL